MNIACEAGGGWGYKRERPGGLGLSIVMDSGRIPVEWPVWRDEYETVETFGGVNNYAPNGGDYLPIANAAEAQRQLREIEESLDWRFNDECRRERQESEWGPNYQTLKEEFDRRLTEVDLADLLKQDSARLKALQKAIEAEQRRRTELDRQENRETEAKLDKPGEEKPEEQSVLKGLDQVVSEKIFKGSKAAAKAVKKVKAEVAAAEKQPKHVFSRQLMKQLL